MKRKILFIAAIIFPMLVTWIYFRQNVEERPLTVPANAETLHEGWEVDLEKSSILWKGHKLFGFHQGSVDFKNAQLEYQDGFLSGGSLTVDMNTIKITKMMEETDDEEEEEEEEEGEGHSDSDELAEHLMSSHFFDSPNYPEARFEFKNIDVKGKVIKVKGSLTIKDTTLPISFNALRNGNKLLASISVDRTKYGIKYSSGTFFQDLGDNIIKDNFDLDITLALKEAQQ
ncbi:YceI family protein [Aureibacter tunicatorum]|uniref:Polyisoprenoid-binding protein YceI n=1 Tax=Aureibacter tunicatorum TaxID=866807 RepID=A0AAE4BR11_9BACT|nr:YceI family protein [Aureibacter tunicatorum]MDR6237295.1 polyisoprenoid-binding protein YceI [Aureibacter tunicatorum]BDD06286.1 hypothetical protein AUTU_37690 [Aureibacter tunicatorum]